ncbi:(2Fe-2S)-binding protein [Streptomyces megasporus]|uniref:(2Fe-2S)-binding protein n=1 Tax=Streptomyces megasporus TaxID=44060 RepID=UPI00068A8913|nr:(2Fe-2S)-binding protein [Streptomyces megasporus]
MSNEQQPIQPDRPVPPPAPQGGWGGEYDGDATAFIQLPGELPGQFHPGADGAHDPLAAPGTGQGWAPPPIEPQPPVTPTATTDPAVPGQWTMPFASGPTDPAPEPPEQSESSDGSPSVAAALGQGAAAALAGSHEARARRPLGDGPARPEPADDRGTYEGTHVGTHGDPMAPSASGADWNAAPAPGTTGQWSIPFAAAGSPDDSGEYLAPAAGPTPAPTPEPAPEPPPPQEPEAPDAVDVPDPVDVPDAPAGDAPARGAGEDEETGTGAGNGSVPEASAVAGEHPHVSYVLRVNGVDRPVTDAWIGESLLYVLRERLGLAGAKDGCSQGECGACSVQVDGRLVASCLVPAATTAGAEVRTVEGLAEDGRPCDVQRALTACGAVQCGFCVPGMAMTLHDLLEGNHSPTELEARQAISGNLCRCSGYRGVLDAVRTVVAEREAAATALAESREAGDRGPEEGGAQVRIPHQGGHAPGGQPPHDHHLPQDGGAQ